MIRFLLMLALLAPSVPLAFAAPPARCRVGDQIAVDPPSAQHYFEDPSYDCPIPSTELGPERLGAAWGPFLADRELASSYGLEHQIILELNLKAALLWQRLEACMGESTSPSTARKIRSFLINSSVKCSKNAAESEPVRRSLRELRAGYSQMMHTVSDIAYVNQGHYPRQHPLLTQVFVAELAQAWLRNRDARNPFEYPEENVMHFATYVQTIGAEGCDDYGVFGRAIRALFRPALYFRHFGTYASHVPTAKLMGEVCGVARFNQFVPDFPVEQNGIFEKNPEEFLRVLARIGT